MPKGRSKNPALRGDLLNPLCYVHKYNMNLLRSTHTEDLDAGYTVVLEVSHLARLKIDLLYSFIEVWLFKNCKSEWTLEQVEEMQPQDHANHTYIRIIFGDAKEAMYFKLSPYLLHNQPSIPLTFLSHFKVF